MKLSPARVALLLISWLVATDLLVWLVGATGAWPLQILLGVSVSLLPGVALLRLLKFRFSSAPESLVYALGLSVFVLMVSGLATNQILFALGVTRPLELPWILGMLNLIILGSIFAGMLVNQKTWHLKDMSWPKPSWTTGALVLACACLPVIAALGAFRLNNGGDWLVSGGGLCLAGGLLIYAFLLRNRLSDTTLAWCIFTIGLSLLLMTALRSWDITGHDLAREFRVYTLTHVHGRWNIAAYRDPYNACLSITILPEVYAKLLHISGLISFRLILQVIFAATPVVMFVMLRRYVSKLGALVGCGLFISYPTFINDSAMLTRQGVAYLFFSLALLTALQASQERIHKALFVLCSLGVVLSHYSTSYMFIAIFGLALAAKLPIQALRGWRLHIREDHFTVLSPTILVILTMATFLWYSQFTATSGGVRVLLQRSLANIPHLLSDTYKSSDTSAALLLASHKTQVDLYKSYAARPAPGASKAESALYMPNIAADNMPLTRLGKAVNARGINPAITTDMRQAFAKILQLLAVCSVLYVTYLTVFRTAYLFGRKRPHVLPLDLICLSLAGIVLLLLMVVLPNLSLNYGVLRTFQQSLIFLVVPLAVLLKVLAQRLGPRLGAITATASMVGLFFLFTGLIAQFLGGVGAPLTLNNQGLYYGLYYTTRADLAAYAWLKSHVPAHSEVRAASFAKAIMHDPDYPFKTVGVLPAQQLIGSYVYLDQAQVVAGKFYAYYMSSPLILTFPMAYYNDLTNQIYSTTTTRVYH